MALGNCLIYKKIYNMLGQIGQSGIVKLNVQYLFTLTRDAHKHISV